MDQTQLAAIEISQNKARTAARFRRETCGFYIAFEPGHHCLSTFGGTFVASPGGYPRLDLRGRAERLADEARSARLGGGRAKRGMSACDRRSRGGWRSRPHTETTLTVHALLN
jgi:hypothetical protein